MSWRSTRASGASYAPSQSAVIDLGSNSWRLVIYSYGTSEVSDPAAPAAGSAQAGPPRVGGDPAGDGAPTQTWWKRTDELYEAVRIGAGMDANLDAPALTEAAMDRGLETLRVFRHFCEAYRLEAGDVHVFATSAIRDATNSQSFRDRVSAQTGWEVELLSAEQEAHYGYVAAINSSTLVDGVVLDIGGGSLQLTEVQGREPRTAVSFPLGAVRMTERFLADTNSRGRVRKRDLSRLRAHVETTLADVGWLGGHGGRLVATGGAVRNLAAAAQRARFGDEPGLDLGIQGFVITAEALDGLVETLAAATVQERRLVPGIKPSRADIILAAAVTLQTVLAVGDFSGIEATEAGLRDGIFLARTILGEAQPRFEDVRRAGVTNLAIQYESDLGHTEHVARLCLQMHGSLTAAGILDAVEGEAELLWAAAMLHDVGVTISYDDHHKHSRYLILSADLPGFDPRERALIAQIARYHRKGMPKLGVWAPLMRRGDEALLGRCAMILRLAEHLERGRDRSVDAVRLDPEQGARALHLRAEGDLTLPRWSVERYGDAEVFAKVFGRPLVIG